MRATMLVLIVLTAACGSSPTSPTPRPPTPSAAGITITAALTSTVTGQAITSVTHTVPSLPALLTLSAPGYITRDALVSSASPTVDLFPEAGFDLGFYRQFIRNTYEAPQTLEPWRRQPGSPHVYVRTIDEAGQPVDRRTVDVVTASLTSDLIGATPAAG